MEGGEGVGPVQFMSLAGVQVLRGLGIYTKSKWLSALSFVVVSSAVIANVCAWDLRTTGHEVAVDNTIVLLYLQDCLAVAH